MIRPGFAAPLWLLLMPPVWLWVVALARRSREHEPGARSSLATLTRLLLASLLVLALAEPWVRGASDRLDVVFAVDVSESLGEAGLAAERDFLSAAAPGLGPKERAAVVVFGGDARVESTLGSELALPPWGSRPDRRASDPGAALRLAAALFEPGSGRRVVLLADGEENRGSLLEAAAAATASGIDLRLVPIASTRRDDARAESLVAPATAALGEPFELRVVVRSPRPGPARLRFWEGKRLLGQDSVELVAGAANPFVLRAQPLEAGLHGYRVEVAMDGDLTPENNAAEATVEVRGAPRVLLVAARPERLQGLAALLAEEQVTAEIAALDVLPVTLAGLRRFRALLLADVAAEELGETRMALLESWVRDAGGTLLMAGGERSFGPGGYLGTAIESALPVAMEVKEKRYFPTVALVTAIDKSGSMAGTDAAQKIEVAKAGAAAAIEVLDEHDLAGIVAFDDAAQWVVRLAPAGNRKDILRRLGTLRAGGGTDIYPAMTEAEAALRASDRRVKHLILLSDGQSPARDYNGLARKMAAARITVSTVAIGSDADSHTLGEIARAGKGRSYLAEDPALLPRIFTKEALTVQRSYVVEESFAVRVVAGHDVLTGIDFASAPPLHGYVASSEKGEGELLLASHRNDPVLAVWRHGLGKAVAFTPDLGESWSRDWAAWPGWGRLWAQIFRWASAGETTSPVQVQARVEGGRLGIVADVLGEDGEFLNLEPMVASAVSPSGRRRELALVQTGPGRYEGEVEASDPGAWLVSVTRAGEDTTAAPGAGGTASVGGLGGVATVDVPYSAELRSAGDGRARLEAVAAATGARIETDPAAVFRHDIPIAGERRPLLPALLWLMPFLLLLDVGVRRVSLPEDALARLASGLRQRFSGLLRHGRWSAAAVAAAEAAAREAERAASEPLARLQQAKSLATRPDAEREPPAPMSTPVTVPAVVPLPVSLPVSPAVSPAVSPPAVEPTAAPAAERATTARLLDLKRRRGPDD